MSTGVSYGKKIWTDRRLEKAAADLYRVADENRFLSWRAIGLSVLRLKKLPRFFDRPGARHYFGQDVALYVRRFCFQNALPYPYRNRER